MSAVLLQVTAGRGPAECAWVAARLVPVLIAEAEALGLKAALLDRVPDPQDGVKSAILEIEGATADTFAAGVVGTIQWVGTSPFRPKHRRKNWFVGVARMTPPAEQPGLEPANLRYTTMRGSGPGGQHVNTTDSAVRLEHLPTGLSVIARDQRSQHANRRVALIRMAGLLAEQAARTGAEDRSRRWAHHNQLERGNPVRVYQGERFRRRN